MLITYFSQHTKKTNDFVCVCVYIFVCTHRILNLKKKNAKGFAGVCFVASSFSVQMKEKSRCF